MAKKLYFIGDGATEDYVLANDLQEVINTWKQFYKTEDNPEQIKLLANYIIGKLDK